MAQNGTSTLWVFNWAHTISPLSALGHAAAFVSGSSGQLSDTWHVFQTVCKRPFSSLGILVEFVAWGQRDKEDDFVDDPCYAY